MNDILSLNQLSQDYWNSNIGLRNAVVIACIVITAVFILVKARVQYESQALMILMGCVVLVPVVVLGFMSIPVILISVFMFLAVYMLAFIIIRKMHNIENSQLDK